MVAILLSVDVAIELIIYYSADFILFIEVYFEFDLFNFIESTKKLNFEIAKINLTQYLTAKSIS